MLAPWWGVLFIPLTTMMVTATYACPMVGLSRHAWLFGGTHRIPPHHHLFTRRHHHSSRTSPPPPPPPSSNVSCDKGGGDGGEIASCDATTAADSCGGAPADAKVSSTGSSGETCSPASEESSHNKPTVKATDSTSKISNLSQPKKVLVESINQNETKKFKGKGSTSFNSSASSEGTCDLSDNELDVLIPSVSRQNPCTILSTQTPLLSTQATLPSIPSAVSVNSKNTTTTVSKHVDVVGSMDSVATVDSKNTTTKHPDVVGSMDSVATVNSKNTATKHPDVVGSMDSVATGKNDQGSQTSLPRTKKPLRLPAGGSNIPVLTTSGMESFGVRTGNAKGEGFDIPSIYLSGSNPGKALGSSPENSSGIVTGSSGSDPVDSLNNDPGNSSGSFPGNSSGKVHGNSTGLVPGNYSGTVPGNSSSSATSTPRIRARAIKSKLRSTLSNYGGIRATGCHLTGHNQHLYHLHHHSAQARVASCTGCKVRGASITSCCTTSFRGRGHCLGNRNTTPVANSDTKCSNLNLEQHQQHSTTHEKQQPKQQLATNSNFRTSSASPNCNSRNKVVNNSARSQSSTDTSKSDKVCSNDGNIYKSGSLLNNNNTNSIASSESNNNNLINTSSITTSALSSTSAALTTASVAVSAAAVMRARARNRCQQQQRISSSSDASINSNASFNLKCLPTV